MNKELADKWTWEMFLTAAQKCQAGGKPFGLGLGVTADSVDWVGALFHSYGADLIDKDGNVTVDSDATRATLDYAKRLIPFLPPDIFAWDDASNNRWLISGNGALIMNPPSAWAVAKRDAPQVAERLWTHGMPRGQKGRFAPHNQFFWGIWSFSPHKSAAKSLLAYLSTREVTKRLLEASQGFDLPAYASMNDFDVWDQQEPPRGTLSHYGHPGDQVKSIAATPAPPKIAVQIYQQAINTKMIARVTQGGESIDSAIAWASKELEGFLRT
jgi:ABC-type glycerol-3-phosphate transport system substrate-binding protein